MITYVLCNNQYQQKKGESSSREPSRKDVSDQVLPAELDFFKYAEGGQSKRKTVQKNGGRETKRRKMDEEEGGVGSDDELDSEDEFADEEGTEQDTSDRPHQRHRVSVKGLNPPKEAASFEGIKERYTVPSQLYANLAKNDYHYPTGIQSSGIPVLLEVGYSRYCFAMQV